MMHPNSRRYRQFLQTYIGPLRTEMTFLLGSVLVTASLELVGPQIVRSFINGATNRAAANHLVMLAVIFIAISLAAELFNIAASFLGENLAWNATNALRLDLMRHSLSLDMTYHHQSTPGEMIERIDGDVTVVANFLSQFAVQMLTGSLLLLGVLFLLFRVNWLVGASLTIFAATALLSLNKVRRFATPHWKSAREVTAELFGFIEEHLLGAEDIRPKTLGRMVA